MSEVNVYGYVITVSRDVLRRYIRTLTIFLWICINTGVGRHSIGSPSWVSEDLKQRTGRDGGSRFLRFVAMKNK